MGLSGTGVLAIWNGIAAAAEDDFVTWHVREHIPERVALPGFVRGRRYVAVDGTPKFFNFYEAESAATFGSDAYRARLDNPTPWTRRVVASFTDTTRTVCDVALSEGVGAGAFVEAIRLSLAGDVAGFLASFGRLAGDLCTRPGIVSVHMLRGLAEASAGGSAEKALRSAPDAVADWVVLVEATDAGPLEELRGGALDGARLAALGAGPRVMRGIYRLQYMLDHADAVAARRTTEGTPAVGEGALC